MERQIKLPASLPDLKPALADLGLSKHFVLVHASDALDADLLLTALLDTASGVVTPTYTLQTLLPLDFHPSQTERDVNALAQAFDPNMPADEALGGFSETVRRHAEAKRSSHPVLSFGGIRADDIINSQTEYDPYAPVAALAERDGVVLLVGLDQRVNFSIHYGEKLAGRTQFIRHALTENGVVECPNFPGDSEGFNAIAPDISSFTRRAEVIGVQIQAIPLDHMLRAVVNKIHQDPYALLCGRPDCERCDAVRWG